MIDGINFYFDKTYYGKGTFECNVFLFTFGLIIIAFFSVGELFITHMLYISKGVTTIEDKSENLFDQLKKNGNDDRAHLERMYETLGTSTCKWMYPSVRKFNVYEGFVKLHEGKTYEEFINEHRQANLKSFNPEFQFMEGRSEMSVSDNNYSNLYDSIKEPI